MNRSDPSSAFTPSESSLCSLRGLIARATDALWQADPSGVVTGVTQCRPSTRQYDGEPDEGEIAQIESLWRKALRVAERFSAVYHVRAPGGGLRNFLVQAVPVFDQRDEVLHWQGHLTEVERFFDSGTRFLSEATAVLSSSLSRATIVNRLIETTLDSFADACALFTFADDGSLRLEGMADAGTHEDLSPDLIMDEVIEAVRTRQPVLVPSSKGEAPAPMRSLVVAPLLVGQACVGAIAFGEWERRASFGAREADIAVIISRQLAIALENIKTFEREQQLTERFRFLARVTERLFTTTDFRETLSRLVDALGERYADAALAVAMENNRIRVLARAGTDGSLNDESASVIAASLMARRSILNGALLKNGPLDVGPRPDSWMMAPLFSGDAVYGAIVCLRSEGHYDASDLELVEEIARRTSLALEHAESTAREHRLIQTLQEATLPAQLAHVEGAGLSAVYRPASSEVQIGGDWYDAYQLDEHRVLLMVGDVTGHGLEASIVMGKMRHAINIVALYERNPARILDAAEGILLRRYPNSVATAFVAIVDTRAGTLTYANAGHPYPLLRSNDGTLKELAAEGLPLGLRSAAPPVKPVTERLDGAALLAFYTDGLTEATHDTLAGERRLREAVMSDAIFYVHNPATFIERSVLAHDAPDDVALLVLNFFPAHRWTFESQDWQAVKAARRQFAAHMETHGAKAADVRAAELIFGELVADVAQYAPGTMQAALAYCDTGPELHLIYRDDGAASAEQQRRLWLVGRLGAQLKLETLPNYGTHLAAVLPSSS
jgi:serine phosphatase RsbU (regulator of sigma subunit)